MKTLSALAVASISCLSFVVGCSGAPADSTGGSGSALGAATASASKYAALAGTWTSPDAVPASADDGTPSFSSYTFAKAGTFTASRACPADSATAKGCAVATDETGTWEVTVPQSGSSALTSVTLSSSDGSETYAFSMQDDYLVLDGIDVVFKHDLASLPILSRGAVCEDAQWNSLGQCTDDIGCDHETHSCNPGS
jgi:hypothetical protein